LNSISDKLIFDVGDLRKLLDDRLKSLESEMGSQIKKTADSLVEQTDLLEEVGERVDDLEKH